CGVLDIDDRTVVFAQDLRHRQVAARGGAAELLAVGGGGVLVLEETMQVGRVRGIDADLERLEPVAGHVALERKRMRAGCDEAIYLGECRRLTLAEIGPEDAA